MRENFPDTDLAAWDIIESFGPTPSGAQGFTVQIPEMDKVRPLLHLPFLLLLLTDVSLSFSNYRSSSSSEEITPSKTTSHKTSQVGKH